MSSHRVICTATLAGSGGRPSRQRLDRRRVLSIDSAPEQAEHRALSPGSGGYFLLCVNMSAMKLPTEDQVRQTLEELRERLSRPSELDDVMLMDYQEEYLTSKLWQKIRRRVLKRDKKTCAFCRGNATVVHHRSYERDVLEGNADHMLVSLCRACHDYIHIDDIGCRRTMEESDCILIEKNPPTHIPEPILDLRRKSAYPPEWSRMNSIQREAWVTRNHSLRKERRVALKEKSDSVRLRRKNSSLIVGHKTWIPLRMAVEQYQCEVGAPSNAYGWYRDSAMRSGFVSIADSSVVSEKINNIWHVDAHEFSCAIENHRSAQKLCKQMTEDYKNGVIHGADGARVKTEWGYYENRGDFRFRYLTMLALRMREPGAWYCNSCNVLASENDEKHEVSCPKCGKIQSKIKSNDA